MSARRESPPIIITPRPEEKPKEEPEQPTPIPPKKIPVKTIIIIAIIAGIIFLSPGNISDKIEKVKSVIPREAPDIPMTCVIHITDFRGEDRIKICDYTETSVNSEGHLIVKEKAQDKSATIYIALDKEIQEKEAIKIECTVKISGDRQSAFGGYTKDSSLRGFTFNGQKIDFFFNGQVKDDLYYNAEMENGEYKISLTRIVSNDNKTAELRASVNPSFGGKYEKTSIYNLFSEKNPKRVGLQFFSRDIQSELEISEIKIYASKN